MDKLTDEKHYFIPAYPEHWTCSQCSGDVRDPSHLFPKIEKIDPAILEGGYQTNIPPDGTVTHIPLTLVKPGS